MDHGRMLMQLVRLIGLATKLLVLRDPKNNIGYLKSENTQQGSGILPGLFFNLNYFISLLAKLTGHLMIGT